MGAFPFKFPTWREVLEHHRDRLLRSDFSARGRTRPSVLGSPKPPAVLPTPPREAWGSLISEVARLEGCVEMVVVLGWGCLGHIPGRKEISHHFILGRRWIKQLSKHFTIWAMPARAWHESAIAWPVSQFSSVPSPTFARAGG